MLRLDSVPHALERDHPFSPLILVCGPEEGVCLSFRLHSLLAGHINRRLTLLVTDVVTS